MSRFPIILLAAVMALSLSACGNKGPLVRPSVEDVEDVSVDDPALDAETSADEAAEDVPVEDADVDDDASTPPADPNAD